MSHQQRSSSRQIKQRVLHTRVPEVLERELKRLADSLRVPVSNIVRAVLENALQTANSRDGKDRATESSGERDAQQDELVSRLRSYDEQTSEQNDLQNNPRERQTHPHRFSPSAFEKIMRSVIGFQPLQLTKPTRCAFCQREIAAQQPAYVTVYERRGPRLIVGEECLPGSGSAI
jgi:hypothetical protein